MTKINKQLPAALMLAVIAGLSPAVAMADAFGSTDPVGVQATTSQRVDKLERELREANRRNEAQAAAAAKDLADAKAQLLKAAKTLKQAKAFGEEIPDSDPNEELALPYEVVGQFNNATLIRQDGKTLYMTEKDFVRFKAKEEAKARALLAPPAEQPLAEVPAPLAAPAAVASTPAAGAVAIPQVSPPVPPSIKPKGPISTNPPGPVAATPVPAAATKK